MIGTLVVNEVILWIYSVALERGEVRFIACRSGPAPAFAGGMTDVEIFGSDGSAIGSVRAPVPAWPELGGDDTLTIPLPMRISEMVHVP